MLPANLISELTALSNTGKSPLELSPNAIKSTVKLASDQLFQDSVLDKISATARILSSLAELPAATQSVQQLGGKVIWQATQQVPNTQQLAIALHDALGMSGLFYESHQAQWIHGERSTDQLWNEPQNVLTEKNLFTISDNSAALPPAKELLNLVQQQLHTLEHHQLTWIGQIWPEQTMQWAIQGEQQHQTQHENERQWGTDIELDLPRLGDIKARLVFTGNGLRLTLHAANTQTMTRFNQALPQLKNSLADANITLISAVVEKR